MRVVLDTNILVSALLFGGRLRYIIDLLAQGDIVPCYSYSTWSELDRVLHYPHLQSALQKNGVLPEELLSRLAMTALIFHDAPSPFRIPEDHDDEAILACAYTANAVAIITGDKHLLRLASRSTIPVMTATQFQTMLKGV